MEHGHFRRCEGAECGCEIKRYWIVALVTFSAFVAEIGGGLSSKSLALLSDGAHVGVDLSSVMMAIGVEYYVRRGGNESKKAKIRGWGGVLSSTLLFVSVALIFEAAVRRLFVPDSVHSLRMIVFAIIGLAGNAVSLRLLHASEEEHVTHAALTAHVVSDLVQSVGVVLVGFAIFFTRWEILDPVSSFVIVIFLTRLSVKTFAKSWKSARSARTQ